jgi:hypothetical protein
MRRSLGRQELGGGLKAALFPSPSSCLSALSFFFSGFNLDVTEENYKQDIPLPPYIAQNVVKNTVTGYRESVTRYNKALGLITFSPHFGCQ